ncbi:hypothetical protein K439DRAFT_1622881 [Ramaria rubella]|nr:hypothetical protein K439DRAFT_1622881 [Ramaria rubella]
MWHAAYPPPDDSVCDYLEATPKDTDEELRLRFLAFLIAIFQCAKPIVEKFEGDYSSLAAQWCAYLADGQMRGEVGPNRKKFYDAAIKSGVLTPECSSAGPLVQTRPKGIVRQLHDILEKFSVLPSTIKELRGVLRVDTLPDSHDPTIIFGTVAYNKALWFVYFNDAHTLSLKSEVPCSHSQSVHDNLDKTLTWLNTNPIFFLFLSTNTKFKPFMPKFHEHPSAMDWNDFCLLPPYTELPYDVFAKGMVSRLGEENHLTLEGVCSIEVLSRFGRPLWCSLIDHASADNQNMIQYAEIKLSRKFHQDDADAQLAALDIRVLLDFDSMLLATREKESKLVEAYMQPLLAEAAARLLNGGKGTINIIPEARTATDGPQILVKAFEGGLLAGRERGEMVARLLMTIIYDRAILQPVPITLGRAPIFHRPIKVLDFLKQLFSEDFHDKILEARPVSDPAGKTLKNAFEKVYLNFSHFSKAGDSAAVELDYLCAKTADNRLIFLSQTTIGKAVASILQIQVKNRIAVDEVIVSPTVTKPNNNLPVLTLLLELGSLRPPNDLNKPLIDVINFEPHITWNYDVDTDPHACHYMIVAHGCTSRTYAAIPNASDALYQTILATCKAVDDFPRQDLLDNRKALY